MATVIVFLFSFFFPLTYSAAARLSMDLWTLFYPILFFLMCTDPPPRRYFD